MQYSLFKKTINSITLLSFLMLPAITYADTLSVQVKETYLRDKPSFLSKQKAKLVYAQQVESKKEKNSWYYIKTIKGNSQGWMHSSALSEQTIVLQSSKKIANSSVSQSEVLMAGKGFSKSVENEYKQQNKSLNYKAVDAIEKTKDINTKTLIHFAKNGKLSL